MKVAVVGGGVIGMSCAYAVLGDADSVELFDAGPLGGGSSKSNGGWVTTSLGMPLSAPGSVKAGMRSALDPRGALKIRPTLDPHRLRWLLRFALSCRPAAFDRGIAGMVGMNRRSLDAFDRMREAGVAFEEHRAGMLAVARAKEGLAGFEVAWKAMRAHGFDGALEHMDGDAARTLEPALGDQVGWAVRTELDRHVAPESLVAGLAAYLGEQGVATHERTAVRSLARTGDQWVLRGDAGELARADVVILAAAVSTDALLRPLGQRLPLVGGKGHTVTLAAPTRMPAFPLHLSEAKLALTPLSSGLRIAGFFELGQRDVAPRPARVRQLIEDAAPYFAEPIDPSGDGETTGWAAMRPATPDGLPFVGPVPHRDGLYVATGHGMLGVTLAPATAEGIAETIRTKSVPAWLLPFQLAGRT